jgi:hypothetical protein
MKRHSALRALATAILTTVAVLASDVVQSQEANYQFGWAPGSNYIYRLDRMSGEVKACEFASAECAVPGEGAVLPPTDGIGGDYEIVARMEGGGVVRLNKADPQESNKLCSVVNARLCCCPGSKVCNANRVCVNP